jgi:hypothetical protein
MGLVVQVAVRGGNGEAARDEDLCRTWGRGTIACAFDQIGDSNARAAQA